MKIVGHRGWPEKYPENTYISMQAALKSGVDAIECDVQFNADGIPYLLHDETLLRVAGENISIHESSARELIKYSVHEPQRFNGQFKPCFLTSLQSLMPLMANFPDKILFLEIKKESFKHRTREEIVDALLGICLPIHKQLVFISYDYDVLKLVQKKSSNKIGFVLTSYCDDSEKQAHELKPDVIICNAKKLPDTALWAGPWEWMVYDIVEKSQAQALAKRGVKWIETWDCAKLVSV